MKIAGFFLSVAGFFLTVSALVLLPTLGLRSAFVFCGFLVECAGLGMVIRSHVASIRGSLGREGREMLR
jgi:hypothetical protein